MPWYAYLSILAVVGVPLTYMWIRAAREERTMARAGLPHVRTMAWPDFQRYLESLFSGLGYQVERPPQRSDYGADLILKDGTGRRTAVNARHFKERITPQMLGEVSEGAEHYNCQDALVVSVIGFTNKVIDQSEQNGTLLWDAGDLADAMEKVRSRPSFQNREPARSGPESAAPAAAGLAATREAPTPAAAAAAEPLAAFQGPACPVCGKPMEPKIAAGRDIWLCSRFPRCTGATMRETSAQ